MFFQWYYPPGFYRNAIETGQVHERGALMWLFMIVFMIFTSTFTHMVVAGVELAETASFFANIMFSMCLIFCG
jgi:ABC-type multidrug transport system permease subunit